MAAPKIANRMPRLGRGNPGRRHLRGGDVTAKMQRQYEHVLESLRRYHRYPSDRKRKQVAAATVWKMAGLGNPRPARSFEALPHGATFEFASEAASGKGPWIKVGGRQFVHADDPHGTVYTVSTGNVRVEQLASNPDDEGRAERIAEEFHGRPARETIEVVEDEAYDDYGAVLGYLQTLKILMEDDTYIPIEFDFEPGAEDNVLVVSGPEGANIEFVGGDQDIDWQDVDGATEADKNLVLVGPVIEIEYFADKHHLVGPREQEDGITYYHEFGEDDGELPYLVFDRRNRKLLLVGGNYTIEAEGITG
jgi:hypothetical protein